MKTYSPRTWSQRLAVAGMTGFIAIGMLELVAGAMKFPEPDTMAIRQQVLAAQSERAYQLRTAPQGEIRIAAVSPTEL